MDKDSAMTQAAKAQERSMEEILASIRRIITDDDAAEPHCEPTPLPPKTASLSPLSERAPQRAEWEEREPADDTPPPASEPETRRELLQSSETMAELAPTRPAFRTIESQRDAPLEAFQTATPPATRAVEAPLLSKENAAAVHSAFGALAQKLPVQNAKTVEEIVKEMLRPMLKAWLDDHLPTLVERLVRAEIERVARG
jgi:uncharacterized protein